MHDSLRPFFSYYGSKWRLILNYYPRPIYGTIIEPFAGSAGYSLRYWDRNIVLNEKDPVLVGLWQYLIRVSEKEILNLPDLSAGQKIRDLLVCQEAKVLIGFCVSQASAQPKQTMSDWGHSFNSDGARWGKRKKVRIASQLKYIRHWKIIEGSYKDLCVAKKSTWFIDPPYQKAGLHYAMKSSAIDFDNLASFCKTRKGQTIVCEGPGATWLPFKPLKAGGFKGAYKKSKESAWIGQVDD